MGPVKWGVGWNIKCHADKLYSEYFCIDGFRWLILIFPNANKLSCLLIPGDLSDLPQFWTKLEYFKLTLIDQTNGQKIIAEEYQHKYTQGMHDWHWGCEMFINLSKLPNTHGFIKNDTCIFEADISVTSQDERVNHACQVASKPATSVKMEPDKLSFGWNIKCHADKLYSEYICIGGFRWLILIFPNANKLSCLLVPGDLSDLPQFWTKLEYFKLTLIDQTNGQKITAEEYQHKYTQGMHDWHWGCERFINLSKLPNTHGFIKNDTCIFEADISVTSRDERVNHACQVASKPAASVENVANPLASSGGELVDFKSFGKIEEAFVPLLEEVCLWHPSLIDCQRKRKRSPRFTEWAFTALGQVLHFLKNKKVKDMNEDACSHLGILWEELESFKFDLTWLQPHVQSALSKKSFVEKVVQLKALKENVVALDMEFKSVEEKLFSAKVDLEKAIRDLSKEGFQERDLDAELGYGGP